MRPRPVFQLPPNAAWVSILSLESPETPIWIHCITLSCVAENEYKINTPYGIEKYIFRTIILIPNYYMYVSAKHTSIYSTIS